MNNNDNRPTIMEPQPLIYLDNQCTKAEDKVLGYTNNYFDEDGNVYAEPIEMHEDNDKIEYCLN